jgi:hypothetical protein
MVTFLYVIFLSIISIYSVFASIQAGESLVVLYPKLSGPHQKKHKYASSWEINNILLVLAFGFFIMVFGNAHFSKITLVPLIFVAAGFLLRIFTGVYIINKDKLSSKSKFLIVLSSYLVPMSLAVIAIDFFTGKSVWDSSTGIILFFTALIGITLIGVSVANRDNYGLGQRRRYGLYVLYGLWAIGLGFLLPHSLMSFNDNLLRAPLTILIIILALTTVSFFLYSAIKNQVNELHRYAILIGLATPVLLGLDLSPYLINNQVTLQQAFRYTDHRSTAITVAAISIIILVGYVYKTTNQHIDFKKILDESIFGRGSN